MRPLYFLHIPKTAGHYISQTLISATNELCENHGLNTRKSLTEGHKGWEPVVEDTYIFTVFRNPINRTASHFIYYNPHLISLDTVDVKNLMLDAVENNTFLQNYQAKFIASTRTSIDEYLDSNEMDTGLDWLESRIARIDLRVKSENITPVTLSNVYLIFAEMLGIQDVEPIVFPDYRIPENISAFSKGVRDSLSPSEVKYLTDINSIDFELYEASL